MLKFQVFGIVQRYAGRFGGLTKLRSLLHKFFICLLANIFVSIVLQNLAAFKAMISQLFSIQQIHFVSN